MFEDPETSLSRTGLAVHGGVRSPRCRSRTSALVRRRRARQRRLPGIRRGLHPGLSDPFVSERVARALQRLTESLDQALARHDARSLVDDATAQYLSDIGAAWPLLREQRRRRIARRSGHGHHDAGVVVRSRRHRTRQPVRFHDLFGAPAAGSCGGRRRPCRRMAVCASRSRAVRTGSLDRPVEPEAADGDGIVWQEFAVGDDGEIVQRSASGAHRCGGTVEPAFRPRCPAGAYDGPALRARPRRRRQCSGDPSRTSIAPSRPMSTLCAPPGLRSSPRPRRASLLPRRVVGSREAHGRPGRRVSAPDRGDGLDPRLYHHYAAFLAGRPNSSSSSSSSCATTSA